MSGIEEAWDIVGRETGTRYQLFDIPILVVDMAKEVIDVLGDDVRIYSDKGELLSKNEAKKYVEHFKKNPKAISLDFCYKYDNTEVTSTLQLECWRKQSTLFKFSWLSRKKAKKVFLVKVVYRKNPRFEHIVEKEFWGGRR